MSVLRCLSCSASTAQLLSQQEPTNIPQRLVSASGSRAVRCKQLLDAPKTKKYSCRDSPLRLVFHSTLVTAGGLQELLPTGRMEGGSVFGQ